MTFSPATERTIGDLHVEVHGSGRPVLLIHGNSGDLHYFDRLIPVLAYDRSVIAMDCRGQGRSARGDGPLTILRMADDAAEVIRAVADAGPVDVVGFSDGANVAMALAVRHPQLVRSLVLNAGNITVDGMRWSVRQALRLSACVLGISRGRRGAPERGRELMRLMLDEPGTSRDDLAAITVPTLVLAGSWDIVKPSHTRMIAQTIPHARRRIIRGGSHFVLRNRPAEGNAWVVDFLTGVDAPSIATRRAERSALAHVRAA